jgi:hypothetical protein
MAVVEELIEQIRGGISLMSALQQGTGLPENVRENINSDINDVVEDVKAALGASDYKHPPQTELAETVQELLDKYAVNGEIPEDEDTERRMTKDRTLTEAIEALKEFELDICDNCIQMTNHIEGVCQKCKD